MDRTPMLMTRRNLLRGSLGAVGALGLLAVAGSTAASAATELGRPVMAAAQHSGDLVAAGTGDIKFDPYFQIVPLRFVTEQIFGRLVDFFGPDPQTPNP